MENELLKLRQVSLNLIGKVTTLADLENLETRFLGRKGELTRMLHSLPELSEDRRRAIGQTANQLKDELVKLIQERKKLLMEKTRGERVKQESIDVSVPGKTVFRGRYHPVTQVMDMMAEIFAGIGYEIVEGPEVESDYYNFEALNIPEGHPARDMQDTFYLSKKEESQQLLLRTHTSPVQIRVMEKCKPPLRIISPGRVYRHEATDATHLACFHQVEGFAVDKDISFADLKGTLDYIVKRMFGQDTDLKFRPSYFPFVEPGAEVDISCIFCQGAGCRACKRSGWIELLGAGMIHPAILERVGIDTAEYSGFAFGIGVERIAMLKFGIDDLRILYENDIRVLEQF